MAAMHLAVDIGSKVAESGHSITLPMRSACCEFVAREVGIG